jgi:hypothetical protein
VWFIFSIVGLWILGLAAIYFACETWMPFVLNNTRDRRGWWVEAQQTELHQDWDRSRFPRVSCMLTAVYAAAETMLTCSTSIALASPVSRLARLVTAGANIFLLALLGAVITSQLTSSVLQQSMPSLQDLQGLRIGASGSILSPFLRNAGITVISYSDVQLAAEGFYNGNPDKLAGFATTTPVAEWMRQTFDKAHQSVLSQPFSLQSNAKEVKAMPMSRAMSKDEAVRFIVAMQQLREESYVAKVINDNILPTDGDQAQDGDVPLVESLRQAVIAAAIGGWCLALGLLVVMLVVDQLSSRDINKDSKSGTTEGAADEEQLRDEWAMNGLKPTTSRKKSLDARPEEPCDQAADAPQHRQVRVETYGHGSAVVDVYSIDAEQHHNLIAGLVNAGILAPVPRASATNNPLRLDHDLAAR